MPFDELDDQDDEEDDDHETDDDGDMFRAAFLDFSALGKIESRRAFALEPLLCMVEEDECLGVALTEYEGGGVRGGREVSERVCLGVPGCDSHMNGTAPAAAP